MASGVRAIRVSAGAPTGARSMTTSTLAQVCRTDATQSRPTVTSNSPRHDALSVGWLLSLPSKNGAKMASASLMGTGIKLLYLLPEGDGD